MATKTCHEKGCNKLPTFNKIKKTSGKFCAEHKKDGMVSIMYRHYNNQVDQIFKLLPQELQWEILVEFVGGFIVRFNRLRRIMSSVIQEKIIEHNFELNNLSWRRLWLKPFIIFPFNLVTDTYGLSFNIYNRWDVKCFRSDGTIWLNYENYQNHAYPRHSLIAVAVATLSHRGACVVLFESKDTPGLLSYGFTKGNRMGEDKWYITDVNDSIILPPYEKHVYPSYPFTNKKLGRPVLKMKLHNPIAEIPKSLTLHHHKKSWLEGRIDFY